MRKRKRKKELEIGRKKIIQDFMILKVFVVLMVLDAGGHQTNGHTVTWKDGVKWSSFGLFHVCMSCCQERYHIRKNKNYFNRKNKRLSIFIAGHGSWKVMTISRSHHLWVKEDNPDTRHGYKPIKCPLNQQGK